MKYSGLRDKHLNVFINYAANGTDKDGEHLENNITKAFINTLESLSNDAVKSIFRNILKDLYDINLPEVIKCKYYLQWESTNAEIKELIVKIPESNRLLLAFSPTGKHWDVAGSDTKDYPTMKKAIEDHYKAEEPDISSDELRKRVEYRLKEIEKLRTGKSIPDGLIIILDNSTNPLYAIALENKKYDLDPYQLNNHLEKSLELHGKEKGKNIIYRKYTDIIDAIKSNGTYMTDSFIEYMAILGYYEYGFNMFRKCFLADKSIRQRLCFHYGKVILESIKGCFDYSVKQKKDESGQLITYSVDKRNPRTWRLHVNYRYLREINLVYKDDKVVLSLAFASRQSAAKTMYSTINPDRFVCMNEDMNALQTFHLQVSGVGRNIKQSYLNTSKTVKEYIEYWRDHTEDICTMRATIPIEGCKTALALYRRMVDEGMASEKDYQNICDYFKSKNYYVLVVPEIVFEPEWTYEEIGKMGKERYKEAIKEKITKALELFDLPTKNNS